MQRMPAKLMASYNFSKDQFANIVQMNAGPFREKNFGDLFEMPILVRIKQGDCGEEERKAMISKFREEHKILQQFEEECKGNSVGGYTTSAPSFVLSLAQSHSKREEKEKGKEFSLKRLRETEVEILEVCRRIYKQILSFNFKEIQEGDYDVWICFTGIPPANISKGNLVIGIALCKIHVNMKLLPRKEVCENPVGVIEVLRFLCENSKAVMHLKEAYANKKHGLIVAVGKLLEALMQEEASVDHSSIESLAAKLEAKLAECGEGNPKDPSYFLRMLLDNPLDPLHEMSGQEISKNPFVTHIEHQVVCNNLHASFETKKLVPVLELSMPDDKHVLIIVFVVQGTLGEKGSYSLMLHAIRDRRMKDVKRTLGEIIKKKFILTAMVGGNRSEGYRNGRIRKVPRDEDMIGEYLDKNKTPLTLYALILFPCSYLSEDNNLLEFFSTPNSEMGIIKGPYMETTTKGTTKKSSKEEVKGEENLSGYYSSQEKGQNSTERPGESNKKELKGDKGAPKGLKNYLVKYRVVKNIDNGRLRMITFERLMTLDQRSTLAEIYRYIYRLLRSALEPSETTTMINKMLLDFNGHEWKKLFFSKKAPYTIRIISSIDHSLEEVLECKFCRSKNCKGCLLPCTEETLEEYFSKHDVDPPEAEEISILEDFSFKIILKVKHRRDINDFLDQPVQSPDLKICIHQSFCDTNLTSEKHHKCAKCQSPGKLQGNIFKLAENLVVKFPRALAASEVDTIDKLVLENYEGKEVKYSLRGVIKWDGKEVHSYVESEEGWVVKNLYKGAYMLLFRKEL